MANTKQQILASALSLDPEDRVELAEELWLSVERSSAAEIDAAWSAEVGRRVEEVKRGDAKLIPGEQVMQKLRDRFCK